MTTRTLGVDVGGTKLFAVVLDHDGEVVGERRLATPSDGDAIVEEIARLASDSEATSVGLGVAGLVDLEGVLRVGPNLPGIVDYPFRARLDERLGGLPVAVDNDANVALLAEHAIGAAAGADDAVLVTLGTGIGAAHVVDGALQRGASGFAGEPGHMIVDPDGPECVCGRRGCWERYASGAGLSMLAGGAKGETVTAAAAAGDPEAVAVLDRFGWWVALGLSNLVAVLDPEVVVVGGGLVESGAVLLEPVRRHYGELVIGAAHRPPVRIEPAALGERAGAIGAALLVGQCGT